MTDFRCNCGAKFSVPDNAVGKSGRCPKCQQVVKIEKQVAEELGWNNDAMPLLKTVLKYGAMLFASLFAIFVVIKMLGIPDIAMVYLSQFAIVTCVIVAIYRNCPEDGKPKVLMLGVAMFGALIYAYATYVPKSERIAQARERIAQATLKANLEVLPDRISDSFQFFAKKLFKDPNSARFEDIKVTKVTLPVLSRVGSGQPGYHVHSTVYATNGFGGVVPTIMQGFYTDEGNLIIVGSVEQILEGMSLDDMDTMSAWTKSYGF